VSFTLSDVQRIAADVARQQDGRLEVVGAVPAQGEAGYTEVILTLRGCQADEEPCRMMIGVTRDASESQIRRAVTKSLREHLDDHPRPGGEQPPRDRSER